MKLWFENSKDTESIKTLKEYIDGITNVSSHHKGVHDKLSHLKMIIDSLFTELGEDLTYPLADKNTSQEKNEMADIDENNQEDKSNLLETSFEGENACKQCEKNGLEERENLSEPSSSSDSGC